MIRYAEALAHTKILAGVGHWSFLYIFGLSRIVRVAGLNELGRLRK